MPNRFSGSFGGPNITFRSDCLSIVFQFASEAIRQHVVNSEPIKIPTSLEGAHVIELTGRIQEEYQEFRNQTV